MTVFVEEKNVKRITNWILPTFSAESFNSFSWKLSKNFSRILQEFQLNPSRVSAESFKSFSWILQEFQLNPSSVSAESFKCFSWILQEFQLNPSRVSAESFKSFSWIFQEFQLDYPRLSAQSTKTFRVLNYIRFLHGLVIVNARGMKLKTFLSQKLLKVFFRTTFKPQVHEL